MKCQSQPLKVLIEVVFRNSSKGIFQNKRSEKLISLQGKFNLKQFSLKCAACCCLKLWAISFIKIIKIRIIGIGLKNTAPA